ncbi:MAG TPA: tripartite tricarboxylate transporter substrate binding protein [Candidatus Sulfotelmatobacter sp.]|nr:tripartite tricarboxylate transporter substrate binding protein [Candidatus Sulfotelmatobacter sp.]
MRMSRFIAIGGMAAGALLGAAVLLGTLGAGTAAAQAFPDRPVRMVVPYPVGGSFDVLARPLAQRFLELTGQTLVIDNRGGANGMIAADLVAKSPPDGYTLLMASAGPITIASALYHDMAYDPHKDLVPVTALVTMPFALFATASFPAHSVADVVAAARAKPGTIAFGLPGNGSVGHLAEAMFAQATGTHFIAVPYRGAGPAMTDLASGAISLMFTTVASAKPLVQSGQLRALAVAAPHRSTALPDMPSFAELGMPQVEASLWIGAMAPAGTPAPVVSRLNALFVEALASPLVKAAMATVGADILAQSPDDFATLLRADFPRWAEVVRRGNIHVE